MHPITFDTKELASYMQHAKAIAPKRPSLAVLGNVHIAHEGQTANLTTTDLGVVIQQELQSPSPSNAPIELCLPVLDLVALVDAALGLGQPQVMITPQESRAMFVAGAVRGKLQTIDPEMFPQMVEPGNHTPAVMTFPAQELARALAYGGLSRSPDESRPVLSSACVRTDPEQPGVLFFDTADGFSLSRYRLAHDAAPEKMQALLPGPLHAQAVELLKHAGPEEHATLQISAYFLRLTLGDFTLSGRLIDGQFPSFAEIEAHIIPDMPTVMLSGSDLARARDLVSLCMLQDTKAMPSVWHVNGDVSVQSASPEKYVALDLPARQEPEEQPCSPWIVGVDMARLRKLIGGQDQIVIGHMAQKCMIALSFPQEPGYTGVLAGLAHMDWLGYKAEHDYAANKSALDRAAAKAGHADQGDLFDDDDAQQEQAA